MCQKAEMATVVQRILLHLSAFNWQCGYEARLFLTCGGTLEELSFQVGMKPEILKDRIIVWDRFGECRNMHPGLSWMHYHALKDEPRKELAMDALTWAADYEATPREMAAWVRAQKQEDLSDPAY